MVVRKSKKSRKKRGSRTYGWGFGKRHRGKGNRGGHGHSGVGKRGAHNESWYHAQGLEPIGKTGMRIFRREPVIKNNPLNLKELEQKIDGWVLDKLATKEADVYSVDLGKLGYTKLLSEGKLAKKINITCPAFSEGAKKKVEGAGGKIIIPSEEKK